MKKHINADVQLQLGHVKRLKEKIEVLAGELNRLTHENERTETKIATVNRRRQSLESDLKRLRELEETLHVDVDPNILNTFDNPMESEILTTVEFHEKMVALRSILHDLLLRTTANYLAAHTEMEDQERDFQQRVADAIRARNLLSDELKKVKESCEDEMRKKCAEYEAIQRLEKAIGVCEAEIWLSRSDNNRLSDQLALLSVEPVLPPCKLKKQAAAAATQAEIVESVIEEDHIRVENIFSGEDTGGEEQLRQHYDGRQRGQHQETVILAQTISNTSIVSEIAVDRFDRHFEPEVLPRRRKDRQRHRQVPNPNEVRYEEQEDDGRRPGGRSPASNVSTEVVERPFGAGGGRGYEGLPPNLFALVQNALQDFGFDLE